MVLVFLACGVVALKQLDVTSLSSLNKIWSESILVAQGGEASGGMGFWSVVFFAWFCNAAMHVGMADLSVFRFAKKASYGWASSAGMYVGHYMAWIAAALMLAAQIKLTQNTNPVPGPMANHVVGFAGIICVIVAGWTTANPTIYRAGLAFQAIVPRFSRAKVTFFAGMVATIAGVFPAFAWKLLTFVGLYGTILAPMGGILFFDWYYKRKADAEAFHRFIPTSSFNVSVLVAWLLPVGIAFYCIQFLGVSAWYCPLPCWVACGLLYLLLSRRSDSTLTA
jgi:NCS1 family nucleobase:cation symporter-1